MASPSATSEQEVPVHESRGERAAGMAQTHSLCPPLPGACPGLSPSTWGAGKSSYIKSRGRISMILMDSCQLRIFWDSLPGEYNPLLLLAGVVTAWKRGTTPHGHPAAQQLQRLGHHPNPNPSWAAPPQNVLVYPVGRVKLCRVPGATIETSFALQAMADRAVQQEAE